MTDNDGSGRDIALAPPGPLYFLSIPVTGVCADLILPKVNMPPLDLIFEVEPQCSNRSVQMGILLAVTDMLLVVARIVEDILFYLTAIGMRNITRAPPGELQICMEHHHLSAPLPP